MGQALHDERQPPSPSSRFIVGQDELGRWVVSDTKGLVGGLFSDRQSAVHFAVLESGNEPGAVCCAPDTVILSLGPRFHEPVLEPAQLRAAG